VQPSFLVSDLMSRNMFSVWETGRGFAEQQQFGFAHPKRQHLSLAAAQRTGDLSRGILQQRENFVDVADASSGASMRKLQTYCVCPCRHPSSLVLTN
jgi:hypothetical protein